MHRRRAGGLDAGADQTDQHRARGGAAILSSRPALAGLGEDTLALRAIERMVA